MDTWFECKFKDTLLSIFTPKQIELLLRLKTVYNWSPEDIASAITLCSVFPKAYRYLREENNILYQVRK